MAEQRKATAPQPPRIESFTVRNYRALKNVELHRITPLTVLLGPNGSGKSTLFDVFTFLSECFQVGLRKAWDTRGRFKELRSRGAEGPIEIEVKYREHGYPLVTYHLAIDEGPRGPFVAHEWLQWSRKGSGKPFKFLDYTNGTGSAVTGEKADNEADRRVEKLTSPDLLAVNSLGVFDVHPRVNALRKFITGWHLSYFNSASVRNTGETGAQEHLSRTGDNLANVIQYLEEQHTDTLNKIFQVLSERVPALERVMTKPVEGGGLLLQFKDAPFVDPILSRYASDGTLKLLAYYTLLYDPDPAPLLGIEEPENFLHPMLLDGLAEACHTATEHSQLIITSHSPNFVTRLQSREVWVLHRAADGYTRVERASQMPGVDTFIDAGGALGDLWMENYLVGGDPFARDQPQSPKSASKR